MSGYDTETGHQAPTQLPPRVRFGNDLENQVIPFAWAEKGLCWLYKNRKDVFAEMMAHIMDLDVTVKMQRSRANGHQS